MTTSDDQHEGEDRAFAWAEYRKDYQPNPSHIGRESIAFRAGWNARAALSTRPALPAGDEDDCAHDVAHMGSCEEHPTTHEELEERAALSTGRTPTDKRMPNDETINRIAVRAGMTSKSVRRSYEAMLASIENRAALPVGDAGVKVRVIGTPDGQPRRLWWAGNWWDIAHIILNASTTPDRIDSGEWCEFDLAAETPDAALASRSSSPQAGEREKLAHERADKWLDRAHDRATDLEEALNVLAHIVSQANVNPVMDGDAVSRYDLPVGSIHKAIPFLARFGVYVDLYGSIARSPVAWTSSPQATDEGVQS